MHCIAREREAEGGGDRAHEQRLGDAGHVVEEHVPVGEQRDGEQARLVGLADDDAPHLLGDRAADLGGGHSRIRRCVTVLHGPPSVDDL